MLMNMTLREALALGYIAFMAGCVILMIYITYLLFRIGVSNYTVYPIEERLINPLTVQPVYQINVTMNDIPVNVHDDDD